MCVLRIYLAYTYIHIPCAPSIPFTPTVFDQMVIRIWLFVFVWHAMMILVCARNRHVATSHGLLHQGKIMQSPGTPFTIKEGIGSKAKEEEVLSRLGSRPPRCEHKCRGCTPCGPVQVPTVHFGPLYANYEPEGWKCKCGLSFYDP